MAKTLMIVDDSATMRKIIMRTVRMSGLDFERTEEAGNGAEALEKLGAGSVDIMLCDINMPEMSGTDQRQLFLPSALTHNICYRNSVVASLECCQKLEVYDGQKNQQTGKSRIS